MKLVKSIALLSMLAFSGAAYAGYAGAPASTGAAPTASPAAKKPRSEKSLECSKQADSQNLHGKPRREFMHKCKRG
jgi:hypothetical protein